MYAGDIYHLINGENNEIFVMREYTRAYFSTHVMSVELPVVINEVHYSIFSRSTSVSLL